VWYVDNQSLWIDLKIIAMTVWKIIKREGISQPGKVTMEEFHPHSQKKNSYKLSGDTQ
jgi:sugar transferase EpsL